MGGSGLVVSVKDRGVFEMANLALARKWATKPNDN
jgi:hypothetical protein